jgi:hypothetical protein
MKTKSSKEWILSASGFILVIALILLTADRSGRTVFAYAEGPISGVTGAPGETTCTQCHHGSRLNPGPGKFWITAPAAYTPGATYQITVTHSTTDPTRKRWGFELTALAPNNMQAGDLQNLSEFTQISDHAGPGHSRQYIKHTSIGTFPGTQGGATWAFNWVAPDTDAGPVTFYAAGNQANNNGNEMGDQIYSAKVVVMPGSSAPPEILSATAGRRDLYVQGRNFDKRAVILVNGHRQTTVDSPIDPSSELIGKKLIKKNLIAPGQTVLLTVKNSDGSVSNDLTYTRPD